MFMVHVSQFYPCTEIKSYAELQYVIELGKQLYYRGQGGLSINGVTVKDALMDCAYWSYFLVALNKGWLTQYSGSRGLYSELSVLNVFMVEYQQDAPDLLLQENQENDEFSPKVSEVYVRRVGDKEQDWEWTLRGSVASMVNSLSMANPNKQMAWVAFLAFVAVERYLTGVPRTLFISISGSVTLAPYVLANFHNLVEGTNCVPFLKYSYDKTVSTTTELNLGYEAWYYRGVIMGIAGKYYTAAEKQERLKALDLQVGDLAFMYIRKVSVQGSLVNPIVSFYPVVIQEINDNGIRYLKINNRRTKCQGVLDFAHYTDETKAAYYNHNPHIEQNLSMESTGWHKLGVEYCLDREEYVITPCYNDDIVEMAVEDTTGKPVTVQMSATDLLYWICRDFEIPFNEQRFLDRYFKNTYTLYEQYHMSA